MNFPSDTEKMTIASLKTITAYHVILNTTTNKKESQCRYLMFKVDEIIKSGCNMGELKPVTNKDPDGKYCIHHRSFTQDKFISVAVQEQLFLRATDKIVQIRLQQNPQVIIKYHISSYCCFITAINPFGP